MFLLMRRNSLLVTYILTKTILGDVVKCRLQTYPKLHLKNYIGVYLVHVNVTYKKSIIVASKKLIDSHNSLIITNKANSKIQLKYQ